MGLQLGVARVRGEKIGHVTKDVLSNLIHDEIMDRAESRDQIFEYCKYYLRMAVKLVVVMVYELGNCFRCFACLISEP